MTGKMPPRWMERTLLRVLPARDRETISGDLLEEYCEEQAPRFGTLRANLWYFSQTVSFVSLPRLLEAPMKTLLILSSLFTALACAWFAVMENILKHPGYTVRAAVAAAIVLQCLATLLRPMLENNSVFRIVLSTGAAAVGLLGLYMLGELFTGENFEGYLLIIGLALIAQGTLTIAVLFWPRHQRAL